MHIYVYVDLEEEKKWRKISIYNTKYKKNQVLKLGQLGLKEVFFYEVKFFILVGVFPPVWSAVAAVLPLFWETFHCDGPSGVKGQF